jgi:hypothetical protein
MYFKNQLNVFPFGHILISICNIEIDVCETFKVKYGLNRMHSFTFLHQVGWFDGKGIDVHPWGLKIKLHK